MPYSDIGQFPTTSVATLEAPSLGMHLLAKFEFDSGATIRRFVLDEVNAGWDSVTWEGFSNPGALQMISVGVIKNPDANDASAVEITINGVDSTFLSQVRQDVSIVYGSEAYFYVQLFNADTAEAVGSPIQLFWGYCGYPKFSRDADGQRVFSLSVDSVWLAKNYEAGGRINDADQKARYPTDRGMEQVGITAIEQIR